MTADIRASMVEVSAMIGAPDDGTPRAAVVWLVKQLKNASGDLIVDTYAKNARTSLPETLARLREDPRLALGAERRHPARFRLRLQSQMGTSRRTKRKKGFIDSVVDATIGFYACVLQDLAAYVQKAPHIEIPRDISQPPPDAEPVTDATKPSPVPPTYESAG